MEKYRMEQRVSSLEEKVKKLIQEHRELEVIIRNSISIPIPKNYESSLFEPVFGHGSKKSKKAKNNEPEVAEGDSEGDHEMSDNSS